MTAAAGTPAAKALSRFRERAEREGLLDIAYATMDSPIGRLLVAATPRGLVRVAFAEELDDAVLELAVRLSPRVLEAPRRVDPARRQLDRYFERKLTAFDLDVDRVLIGAYARRVLERTADIPYGSCSSYRDVARDIGTPLAARAVGNALGSNPIPVVIPCHRVLRTGGALGGYGGGLDRKRFLLQLEGALPAAE
jgi:methylated-DNA-[protein]-cysteine S-methyltransferase